MAAPYGLVVNIPPRGYLYGLAAYGLWGLFPLYFKLLHPATPIEILAHRIVWSVAFIAVILLILHRWAFLRTLARQPRTLLGLATAAALIGINWGTYIYGVNTERVVETSLGYFITPLVSMLLGVIVLRERLHRWQWVALAVGTAAVCLLAVDYGHLPYVALTLAASFGTYGLIKKRLALPPAEGLFAETAMLAAPALLVLWWLSAQGNTMVGQVGAGHTALVLAAGAVTAVPLLLFAGAANRIPLTAIGILQYIAPVMQFSLGVFAFGEPMPPMRIAGFGLVWLALAIFTTEALWRHRTRRRAAGTAPATPAIPGR